MPQELFQRAVFQRSCYRLHELPEDKGGEIIFLGRSNVGKSTFINALCAQKSLARVSKTPGRTQCLNVFKLSENARFIDAPGYGFAKVRHQMMLDWQQTVIAYCQQRACLKKVVLIMDARHPLQDNDKEWLDVLVETDADVMIVLSKADKLSKQEQAKQLRFVQGYVAAVGIGVDVQLISSKKGSGIPVVRSYLQDLYTAYDES